MQRDQSSILLALLSLMALVLALAFTMLEGDIKDILTQQTNNIAKAIKTPAPSLTQTPSYSMHQINNGDETMTLWAPSDWEFELASQWKAVTGHVCRSYSLTHPEGIAILFITPPCGYKEGLPGECHFVSTLVKKMGEMSLMRYYDSEDHVYSYEMMGVYSTTGKPMTLCTSLMTDFEIKYFGSSDQPDNAFATIDEIVLSVID
jgi:hypothetical protein